MAELGIACEACHGPGELHVRANTDPLRRYVLRADGGRDPTIVNPARLSPERAADVCGRCHGQRIADRVERFLARGDPFVPGEPLELYSSPLWQDTTLGSHRDEIEDEIGTEPLPFAERFWSDGTARLTAYELQGLLQSPCRGLTCTTCHSMHDGDPRGQVRPGMAGRAASDERGDSPGARDALCTGCHEAFASPAAAAGHASHRDASARCVDCHMPRVVYGLVDAHRSHRIESPDPARDARHGRPDACTSCHTSETRAWAIAARRRLWPRETSPAEPLRNVDSQDATPEVLRALLGGDPIERALAARALGEPSSAHAASTSPADHRARSLGALLDAMEDEYPAVRRIAWRSARRIARGSIDAPVWRAFDPTGDATSRQRAIAGIRAHLDSPTSPIDRPTLARLRAEQRAVRIAIGE